MVMGIMINLLENFQIKKKQNTSNPCSVRNKKLSTCPPQVEFARGKLTVSEG